MKSYLEKSFSEIGVKPVSRRKINGQDILLADGFVSKPYPALKKFGIDKDDFPQGCYTTVWLWGKDDKIGLGLPIFFDPLHNIEHPLSSRQTMRINTAVNHARRSIEAFMREKLDA